MGEDTVKLHEVAATPDGEQLSVHHWRPEGPARGVLFYIHGIQSHAGWLFESGPRLAELGVEVVVPDRRGSGASSGPRGHLGSVEAVLDDYARTLASVRTQFPDLPLTVVGQSFGGSILAALVSSGRVAADRLVFCAPALGQQRSRHGNGDALSAIRAGGGRATAPVPLTDEQYTDQPAYLDFMANDRLMLRQTTLSTRAAMVGIEDVYMRGGPWSPADREVYFVWPETDDIIDLPASWRVLAGLHDGVKRIDIEDSRHYVEFSPARFGYWDWLGGIAV